VTAVAGGTGGAVLCGGRSLRFGQDKALVEIDGRPMAECVAAVLEAAGCSPVVFVGGDGERLTAATGRQFVDDTWPGQGPLGGVVDALRWFRRGAADGVVIAACDLPDLSVEAVRAVAGAGGAAVAVAERRHPALARWPISASDHVEALFAAGIRSLHEALDALGAIPIRVDAAAVHNVNLPEDLRLASVSCRFPRSRSPRSPNVSPKAPS
jgi:molybdenum cofactor guanylyltransferase